MPLTREYRLFVLDARIMLAAPYWEEGEYDTKDHCPLDMMREVATRVQSRFFTLDIAKCVDSTWTITEPGDGQVAGLPASIDAETFYQALANHFH